MTKDQILEAQKQFADEGFCPEDCADYEDAWGYYLEGIEKFGSDFRDVYRYMAHKEDLEIQQIAEAAVEQEIEAEPKEYWFYDDVGGEA